MPWSLPSKSTMTLAFRRKRYCITAPDPSYQVVYLGNVLTAMAKGEGCVDKPLSLIWKTYSSRSRPDLPMKLTVSKSGIKAETKQQGLTEYWSHRITHCLAPTEYPKVFCWIYKHEGKRMKPELRCHAVLCKKISEPVTIRILLEEALTSALQEYKREKIDRQNARLNGCLNGMPCQPRRKQLKSCGALNFRPPISRSKSAPKLGTVDEEEEEEEVDVSVLHQQNDETPTCSTLPSPNSMTDCHSDVMNYEHINHENLNVEPYPIYLESVQFGLDRLRIDCDLLQRQMSAPQRLHRLGSSVTDTEPDSISDESGYHEKSSLEGDDNYSDDSDDMQITAL